MSSYVFQTAATSKTITVRAYDSTTFLDKTGLVFNTSGLTAYYRAGATGSATAITLATQTVGGAWATGGFVEIDATNQPGEYRLDLPNAVLSGAAGTLVSVKLKGTGVVFQPVDILLLADDPAGAAATVAAIADGVWDEVLSGHLTAGSTGKAVADIETDATLILGDTVDIQGRLPAALVSGRIDASVGAAAANTLTASALATDAVNEIVAAVFARAFHATKMSGLTFEQIVGLTASTLLSKASGMATTAAVIRNPGDTADAVTATVDADGNRSAVTLNTAAVA